MIKLKTMVLAICLIPGLSFATPQKIEMIFLSPLKVSMILKQLDKMNAAQMSKKLTQTDMERCVPMGDGCFHPQYGYMEKQPEKKPDAKEIAERNEEKSCSPSIYFKASCISSKFNFLFTCQ